MGAYYLFRAMRMMCSQITKYSVLPANCTIGSTLPFGRTVGGDPQTVRLWFRVEQFALIVLIGTDNRY